MHSPHCCPQQLVPICYPHIMSLLCYLHSFVLTGSDALQRLANQALVLLEHIVSEFPMATASSVQLAISVPRPIKCRKNVRKELLLAQQDRSSVSSVPQVS